MPCAQRRPEITPGYDPVFGGVGDDVELPLNEGRRLPPATTLRRVCESGERGDAQRRPEITPGYDLTLCRETVCVMGRSTKAGDYPRLRRATTWRTCSACAPTRSTKAGDYPRLRLPAASATRVYQINRSTKAGDYPRLRPLGRVPSIWPLFPLNEGRRLPPATTVSGPLTSSVVLPAQRRPEITPGYDQFVPVEPPSPCRRSTKAGDYPRLRRLEETEIERPALPRSTKAGDYPRLRPAHPPDDGRPAPRSTKAGDYPRLRPPAQRTLHDRLTVAQRRPEITPGYDRATPTPCGRLRGRSTKAGDYPRLRRECAGARKQDCKTLNEGRRLPPATTRRWLPYRRCHLRRRSTKAGDYPRLRLLIRGDGRFRTENGFDHTRWRSESHGTDPILLNSWQFPAPHTPFPGCERRPSPGSPEVRRSLR